MSAPTPRTVAAAVTGDKPYPAHRGGARDENTTTAISRASLPYLLAAMAGWMDALCFKQYKCFANMMSGNTVQVRHRVAKRLAWPLCQSDTVEISLFSRHMAALLQDCQRGGRRRVSRCFYRRARLRLFRL